MTASNGAERAEHAPRDGALCREERLERWTEIILAVVLGLLRWRQPGAATNQPVGAAYNQSTLARPARFAPSQ